MELILSDRPLDLTLPSGEAIRLIDLSTQKIAPCVGCFGCWTKTPGRCVIRDDAVRVYPLIAESDSLIYVSRIRYGGYDTPMKTMLERAIPVQQAFIRILNGETHHIQRQVAMKDAVIIGYGTEDAEEQALFRRLVARNAANMQFGDWRVRFESLDTVEEAVRKEVAQWVRSCS